MKTINISWKKALVACFSLLLLGGVYMGMFSGSPKEDEVTVPHDTNYTEIELRFRESLQQNLTWLFEQEEFVLVDFDPKNYTSWGIIRQKPNESSDEIDVNSVASVRRTIVVGFDFNQINFDEEMVVFSVNRRIVRFIYPINGIEDQTASDHGVYHKAFWPTAILSREFYPDTVFFYVAESLPTSSRMRLTTLDRFTQIEE